MEDHQQKLRNYIYQQVQAAFDADMLNSVFIPKKSRKNKQKHSTA